MCSLFHQAKFPFAIAHCNFQLRGDEATRSILETAGIACIVRGWSGDPGLLSRYLDLGADGVMVAAVETPQAAKALAESVRYARFKDWQDKLVIGMLDVPVFARLVRAEVLALRAGGFVEAAVNAGNPTWRILFVHLLPNCIRGAMAQMPIRMAWAVRVSATLAFIGVGIQAPTPEWGAMIRQGADYMISGEWWVSIVPGVALVTLIIGFSMFGDGLEELLDPRRQKGSR
jgi:ABC-type dipeptide/oligopeptide/nickel transport system permease subunit